MAKELGFKQGAYKEAVDYFKQKINLPTKRWNDLKGAMHTRAFTVAGAMRADILLDFRNAVDKAIEKGESLQDFRDNFYKIASKWRAADPSFDAKMEKPKYGAWRSKVIYQTNMLTAAAAAQERQAREMPEVFTHAKYVCMMMPTSREQHKAWNGTVLPVNDPWWEKHSPPNGFGCLCEKEFISKYEMKAGLEKETKAPTPANDTTNIGENWDYSIGDADAENQRLKEQLEEKEFKLLEKFDGDTELSYEIERISAERHENRTPETIQNVRDRLNDRKDEKTGNIPKVKIDKDIDKFEKPEKLFEYMERKRGFKIDDDLKEYDLEKVKGFLKGIDAAMTAFPEAKITLLEKHNVNDERSCTKFNYKKDSPFSIGINEKCFGKEQVLGKNFIPFVDNGMHPKNSNPFSSAVHEMGHVILLKMTQMESFGYCEHYDEIAKEIVNKAVIDSGLTPNYENIFDFRKKISLYADHFYKYAETIAEAMSDVFNNRSKAAVESKAVYKVLMERLKKIRQKRQRS
jgi:hypothetical protein